MLVSCGREEDGQIISITFVCVDDRKNETRYAITTSKKTLRGALEEQGLIRGRESVYGLYVMEVCGMRADPDTDGAYWALYIGDEYSLTGVDSTKLSDGETYSFIYTPL